MNEKLNRILKGFAFIHIPINEYNYVWSENKVSGTVGEIAHSPPENSGIFERF